MDHNNKMFKTILKKINDFIYFIFVPFFAVTLFFKGCIDCEEKVFFVGHKEWNYQLTVRHRFIRHMGQYGSPTEPNATNVVNVSGGFYTYDLIEWKNYDLVVSYMGLGEIGETVDIANSHLERLKNRYFLCGTNPESTRRTLLLQSNSQRNYDSCVNVERKYKVVFYTTESTGTPLYSIYPRTLEEYNSYSFGSRWNITRRPINFFSFISIRKIQ